MMTKQIEEALRMAIEALETTWDERDYLLLAKTINTCKEALEQPAQEPVEYLGAMANVDGSVNLYYKKSSWQGLTAQEIASIPLNEYTVQTVERMLKEKNNAVQ